MANDVKFEITADANKANAELEKLRSQVAKLTNAVDKSKSKSKEAGDAGEKAFGGMSNSVNSTVQNLARSLAVMQTLKAAFKATMNYYKEIREQEDKASVSIDKNISGILKEGGFNGRNDRSRITSQVFKEAQRTGLNQTDISKAMQSAVNNGASVEDLMSGKHGSTLDVMRATGFKDSGAIEDMFRSELKRSNLKDTAENRAMLASKNVSVFGQDYGEGVGFLSHLPKNVSVDEGLSAYSLAKDFYGSPRKAGSALQSVQKPEDYAKFLTSINATKKDVDRGVSEIRAGSEGKFRNILSIADTEQEARINRSASAKEYFNYKPNLKTQEQLKNERELENQRQGANGDLKNIISNQAVDKLGLSEENAKGVPSQLNNIAGYAPYLASGPIGVTYLAMSSMAKYFTSESNKNQIEAGSKKINTTDSKANK